jgi:signal transduction histidine kinase
MKDMAKEMASRAKISSTSSGGKPSKSMSMEQALAALIQRNEELISLNKSKDEFIAITSHQLRTPATGVKQYLGLLLEGYAEPLTENQKIFLEKAYENNERQLHIVDDILRVAQLDLDKIRLELAYTDIREIIQEAVSALEGRFQLRNQTVKITSPDELVLVKIDAEQLRMVIENLLENASNY